MSDVTLLHSSPKSTAFTDTTSISNKHDNDNDDHMLTNTMMNATNHDDKNDDSSSSRSEHDDEGTNNNNYHMPHTINTYSNINSNNNNNTTALSTSSGHDSVSSQMGWMNIKSLNHNNTNHTNNNNNHPNHHKPLSAPTIVSNIQLRRKPPTKQRLSSNTVMGSNSNRGSASTRRSSATASSSSSIKANRIDASVDNSTVRDDDDPTMTNVDNETCDDTTTTTTWIDLSSRGTSSVIKEVPMISSTPTPPVKQRQKKEIRASTKNNRRISSTNIIGSSSSSGRGGGGGGGELGGLVDCSESNTDYNNNKFNHIDAKELDDFMASIKGLSKEERHAKRATWKKQKEEEAKAKRREEKQRKREEEKLKRKEELRLQKKQEHEEKKRILKEQQQLLKDQQAGLLTVAEYNDKKMRLNSLLEKYVPNKTTQQQNQAKTAPKTIQKEIYVDFSNACTNNTNTNSTDHYCISPSKNDTIFSSSTIQPSFVTPEQTKPENNRKKSSILLSALSKMDKGGGFSLADKLALRRSISNNNKSPFSTPKKGDKGKNNNKSSLYDIYDHNNDHDHDNEEDLVQMAVIHSDFNKQSSSQKAKVDPARFTSFNTVRNTKRKTTIPRIDDFLIDVQKTRDNINIANTATTNNNKNTNMMKQPSLFTPF